MECCRTCSPLNRRLHRPRHHHISGPRPRRWSQRRVQLGWLRGLIENAERVSACRMANALPSAGLLHRLHRSSNHRTDQMKSLPPTSARRTKIPRRSTAALAAYLKSGTKLAAMLYAFDLLELDGNDLRREPIETARQFRQRGGTIWNYFNTGNFI
jgi:hypothetical protein